MSKILVTGARGFLGKKIIHHLIDKNVDVIAFSRTIDKELESLQIKTIEGDITDFNSISAALNGVEAVFHVASKVGMWGNYKDFYNTNVIGTKNVIDACLKNNVKRLVYTSTPSVVFGKSELLGVNESTPYPKKFLTHYASTKAEAEKLVLAANGKNGLLTTSLRPHLIYGEEDLNLLPRLAKAAAKGRLRKVGDGKNLVDVIYVDNAADSHLKALDELNSDAKNAGKAYFISQERPVNCWEFINLLLDAKGVPSINKSIPIGPAYSIGAIIELIFKIFNIKNIEPPMTRFIALQLGLSHYFDMKNSKNDFGHNPSITIENSIKRIRDHFSKNNKS